MPRDKSYRSPIVVKYGKFYHVWQGMKFRCFNPKYFFFHRYGGRGITVSERWLTFDNFREDMHSSYKEGLSLDRIDNDKGYSKENCRWATAREQARNTRRNHWITFGGKTQTMMDWAREMGVSKSLISQRLNVYGWSIERTLTEERRSYAK